VPKLSILYGVSFVAHATLALGVATLRRPEHRETIAISVSETKKKPPEPAKMVEPAKVVEDHAAPRPQARAKVAPAAPKADAPPPAAAPAQGPSAALAALPDFGLSMGNGGPGGLAVPQGGPVAAAPSALAAVEKAAPRVLAPRPVEECSEPPVKPKPRSISQPAYTSSARDANVEGRVRVEVSVDADGHVTGARLLAGLGYGLDEAALEAARRASFEPATRCGKHVAATFVIAMRFSL
jgi:protein TonB